MDALINVYPGTPIEFIPIWVVDIWRVVVWAAMLFALGDWLIEIPRVRHSVPRSTLLGFIALFALVVRDAFVMAERWHEPAIWEGLPVTTFAIVLVTYARVLRKRRQRARQRAS